jgi:hypothetical protein
MKIRRFRFGAALAIGAALLVGLFGLTRPASASLPVHNGPSAEIQLLHTPIGQYYNPTVGPYAGDRYNWWVRFRYHTDSRAVTPTSDNWTFTSVVTHWSGQLRWTLTSGWTLFDGGVNTSTSLGSGSAGGKTTTISGSTVLTDAWGDKALYFGDNPLAPTLPPYQIDSTYDVTFHFQHIALFQVQQGWMAGMEDYTIHLTMPIDTDSPVTASQNKPVSPLQKAAPRWAVRSSGMRPVACVPMAPPKGGRG